MLCINAAWSFQWQEPGASDRRLNSHDAKLQGCHGMQLGGVERFDEEAWSSAIISRPPFINSIDI